MNPDEYEIVGEHFWWIRATSEIEDIRDESRRPDSDYAAKVDVYEDRVLFWFLNVARAHVANGSAPGDYVALSIALAYIEGVEQYRQGKPTPRGDSGRWFKAGVLRAFPVATEDAVNRLWDAARCGLFHDGFTRGPTIVSHGPSNAIAVAGNYLRINPERFVSGVIQDFENYVQLLRGDPSAPAAVRFAAVWDDQWNAT